MIWLSRSSGNPHCHSVDRVMKEKCGVLSRPFLKRTAVCWFHSFTSVWWNDFMGYDCKPIKCCLQINLWPKKTTQLHATSLLCYFCVIFKTVVRSWLKESECSLHLKHLHGLPLQTFVLKVGTKEFFPGKKNNKTYTHTPPPEINCEYAL